MVTVERCLRCACFDLEGVSVTVGESPNPAADFDYLMTDRLRAESAIRASEKLAFQDAGTITNGMNFINRPSI